MQDNQNSFLVKLLKYGVYLSTLVPLVIFSNYVSPFHFGKVVIFRSLIEILLVFYLILIIKDRRYLPPRHLLLFIVGLFTIFLGISTFTSVNPYLSFWGSLERMGGFWTFAHFLIYFLILTSVFKTKEDWYRLLKLTVLVGVLSAFYGFLQKTNWEIIVGSGNRTRIFGTIGNAALFAGYQVVNLFLALMLALSSWAKPKEKIYFFLVALVSTAAILMTAVRGSILGIGVGFLIFAGLYFFTHHQSKVARKILTGLLVLLVLFVGFSFAFKNTQFVKNSGYLSRVTNFSLTSATVQTRFWAWEAGFTGWRENPKTVLLGWGPENFNVPFSKYFNPQFYTGSGAETLFDRAHNMFVEVLVTMGLLSFLAYLGIFIVAFRLIWIYTMKEQKIEKPIGIGLISLLAAYIIHNFFIFDTSANFLVFFTVLGLITYLTTKTKEENRPSQSVKTSIGGGLGFLMIVLLIASLVLIYKTNILPAKANYATTRGILRGWANDFGGAVAKFQESVKYETFGKYEYRHRYAQFLTENFASKGVDENQEEIIKYAISEVQKNVDETNQDYLPYLYLSRLYIILGRSNPDSEFNDKALENSLKALEIAPQFVRTYFEVAQAYLNKNDYQNAIKYFQEAVDLNPNTLLSSWYLGAAYLQDGQVDRGLEIIGDILERGYGLSESDANRLLNIYIARNDNPKIVQMLEVLIRISPSNPQYHASLAAAYAQLGRIDEAVNEARATAQLDENFESEARSFVKSLGREF